MSSGQGTSPSATQGSILIPCLDAEPLARAELSWDACGLVRDGWARWADRREPLERCFLTVAAAPVDLSPRSERLPILIPWGFAPVSLPSIGTPDLMVRGCADALTPLRHATRSTRLGPRARDGFDRAYKARGHSLPLPLQGTAERDGLTEAHGRSLSRPLRRRHTDCTCPATPATHVHSNVLLDTSWHTHSATASSITLPYHHRSLGESSQGPVRRS